MPVFVRLAANPAKLSMRAGLIVPVLRPDKNALSKGQFCAKVRRTTSNPATKTSQATRPNFIFAAKVAAFKPLSLQRIHRFAAMGGSFVLSQIAKFGFMADNSRAIVRVRAQRRASADNETFNACSPRTS